MLTWCDGLSDVPLDELLAFHRAHGKLATITVVRAPSRFGFVEMASDSQVQRFTEKPDQGEGWINGAFFVLEPGIFDYIAGDETMWEREPLQALAADGQLVAYTHRSFWQCMDTLREKTLLETLWSSGAAPWKHGNSQIGGNVKNSRHRTYGLYRHRAHADAAGRGPSGRRHRYRPF